MQAPFSGALAALLVTNAGCEKLPPPPLLKSTVIPQLNDELTLAFSTGPDNPHLPCARMNREPEEDSAERAAFRAGWLERRCVADHIEIRLTEEGTRRSTYWGRSGDRMDQGPRDAETYAESASWFVKAATFRREDRLDIEPGETSHEKRVVDHGQWVPSEDGLTLLSVAHWPKIAQPYRKDDFVYWHNRWMPAHAAGE